MLITTGPKLFRSIETQAGYRTEVPLLNSPRTDGPEAFELRGGALTDELYASQEVVSGTDLDFPNRRGVRVPNRQMRADTGFLPKALEQSSREWNGVRLLPGRRIVFRRSDH